jgi:hypothetical protein
VWKENGTAKQDAANLRYRPSIDELIPRADFVKSLLHLLKRRSAVRVAKALPSEPVGQSRELRNQPEASDCIVRRFEFEKERTAWRTVKAVMCGRTPEIYLFPERALGKVIKPVLVGNANVPIHFGPLLYLLAQLHQLALDDRKDRFGIKSTGASVDREVITGPAHILTSNLVALIDCD